MSFVLRSKQLFLTYPKCNASPEFALEQLQQSLPIQEYIIAQEDHKDGTKHLHAYIKLTCQKRCNVDMLDIADEEGDTHHGNYQKCRNAYLVQKYCKKGGIFITNMKFNLLAQAVDLARSGDVKAAFTAVTEARPDMILTAGKRVKAKRRTTRDSWTSSTSLPRWRNGRDANTRCSCTAKRDSGKRSTPRVYSTTRY